MLSGYFKEVVMVFGIVFIHEMGHSIAAHHYKWRIRKIELLPFGGVAEVEEYGNRPLKEEFVVLISGPLQHVWLIGLSFFLVQFEWWSEVDHLIFIQHNLMISLFNLLPIWPLDGGKLLYLLFSLKMPFQKAHIVALKWSLLLLIFFTITSVYMLPFHLNLWIVIIFLLFSHYFEWKQHHYVFMRFLMDRYYKPLNKDKLEVLRVPSDIPVKEVIKKFKRGVKHSIVINGAQKELAEKEVLTAFFEKRFSDEPICSLLLN